MSSSGTHWKRPATATLHYHHPPIPTPKRPRQ
jgi:hypothetical protein